jgi:hypothetical protein
LVRFLVYTYRALQVCPTEVTMRGGKRPNAGRRSVQIDVVELEKLCALQCTHAELAAWFNVSPRTIEARRKQPQFYGAMERGKAKGRISVRRAQMRLLEAGNATMGVWLGNSCSGRKTSLPTNTPARPVVRSSSQSNPTCLS